MTPENLVGSTFVKSVKWLDEVDSTNDYAIRNVDSFDQPPVLIGSELQTSGRGRGANRWWGGEGSLTFSLILQPDKLNISAHHWPIMSLMVGLSIRETILEHVHQYPVHLKWPNDLYVNNKKICGILIETIPAFPEYVIIGIGLNVNNSILQAPEDIKKSATSMKDLTRSTHSRETILISLLNHLESILSQISSHYLNLIAEWRTHCFLTGKTIEINESQNLVTGECTGIDDDGGLLIKTSHGLQKVFAGTVNVIDHSVS